jgi:hypothetical protein
MTKEQNPGTARHSVFSPAIVTEEGLDLTLLIPFMVVGAVWLLQRRPWGYVLAAIITVKGSAYTLVLAVGSLSAANAGIPSVSTEIPIWVFLTAIELIANVLLFRNMNAAK